MKFILTENQNIRLRRVYHLIQDFMNDLSPEDICSHWNRDEGPSYISQAMGELSHAIGRQYDGMSFDEIYDMLVDADILSDITEFFYDTIDECN